MGGGRVSEVVERDPAGDKSIEVIII